MVTARLLLAQTKGQLDKNLLKQNIFVPNLSAHNLIQIVEETIEILSE